MAEARRTSIDVAHMGHGGLPIPTASRIGPFIASGGIRGVGEDHVMPADVAEQVALMFRNVELVMQAAGASTGDILKMTIWIADPEARAHVNQAWVALFPDPASRPARHTLSYDLPGGMLVQCDLLAIAKEA